MTEAKPTYEELLARVAELEQRQLEQETAAAAAGEALRDSERKFATAFKISPYAITITRASDGAFIEVNDAFTSLTGWTRDEALAGSSVGMGLWVDQEDRLRLVGDHKAGRTVFGREFRFRKKSGEVLTGLMSAQLIDLPPHGVCVLASVHDMTERKQMKAKLSERVKELTCLYGVSALAEAPTRSLDDFLTGTVLLIPSAWQFPEMAQARITLGKQVFETPAFHLTPWTQARDILVKGSRVGEVVVCYRQERPESDHGPFLAQERILLDAIAERVGSTIERKWTEEELRKSRYLTDRIIESSPNLIYIYDLIDRRNVYANKEVTEFLGYSAAQVQALGASLFANILHPDDADLVDRHHARFETIHDRVLEVEYRMRHADGQWRWLRSRDISFESTPEGTAKQILGSAEDITEHKQTSKAFHDLEGQLHQSQKMESVGRLAGGVAHDFNNMLSVILTNAEFAKQQVDPRQPIHADLEEIHKAALRSADLTRQLLAFARKQTIAPKVLDLNQTVSGMLKMLRRLIGENLTLTWQPKPNLWLVKMDPAQIDQILVNLCVNARDAIGGVGTITIEVDNSDGAREYCAALAGPVPGEYVRIVVSDDGCGMDKDTLSHVFEPFFTTKGSGKGTGLGLATVYGIVKQNEGFINVCSEPGQGTTFTIYLRRHVGKGAQVRTPQATRAAPRGHETILLVEDELAILRSTGRILNRLGYVVLAASTPGEAIRLAEEHSGELHLLLTDVVMPEMNGRTLAKNVLSLYPKLRRLFMSGYTADMIAHHGVLDEGVHFIQKPFSSAALAAKLREVLDD